jgi:TP901 family phage tail tape measure protein
MSTYVELKATIADFSAKMGLAVEEFGMLERANAEAALAMEASSAQLGAAVVAEAEAVTAAAAKISTAVDRSAMSLEKVGISAETAATQNKLAMEKMSADTAAMSAKMELAATKAEASNIAIATSAGGAAADVERSAAAHTKAYGLATLATVALAVSSVKMAADYETSTARLVTSAGESEKAIEEVRTGMLKMAGEVGMSAEKLSEGMYTVESAGYHGADALTVLKSAAQGAREENASLKTVADAVSTALTDYHMPASNAGTVTSQLVTAVSQGKTTMEEFSGSLHSITPMAAAVGISLADVTGTLAEMTAHGMSADQGAQNLGDTLRHLLSPTQSQRQEMAQLGITSSELSGKLGKQGISGTLDELSQAIMNKMGPSGKVLLNAFNQSKDAAKNMQTVIANMPAPLAKLATDFNNGNVSLAAFIKQAKGMPGDAGQMAAAFLAAHNQAEGFTNALKNGSPQAQDYTQAMYKLTGDATGLNTALMVTGKNSEETQAKIKLIADASTEAGGNVKGWHEIQDTFNQKVSESKAALGALWITIGTQLLPIIQPIVAAFADFANWLSRHPTLAKAVAIGLTVIAVALGIATIAVWAMNSAILANPITWIITAIIVAIVAVVAAIIFLVKNWSTIWSTMVKLAGDAWKWIVDNVGRPIHDFFTKKIPEALAFLRAIWDADWKFISDVVGAVWKWIVDNVGRPIHDFFTKKIPEAVDVLKNRWNTAWRAMSDELTAIYHWIKSNVLDPIGSVFSWVGDRAHEVSQGISIAFHKIQDVISGAYQAVKPILDAIGSAISKVTGAIGSVSSGVAAVGHFLGFADGGWVPGSPGQAQMAVVHGGEYVLSREMLSGQIAPDESIARAVGDIGSPGYRPGGAGASTGASGGGGVNIFVTVQGRVTSDKDLAMSLREQFLRYNLQNSSNGLSVGVA